MATTRTSGRNITTDFPGPLDKLENSDYDFKGLTYPLNIDSIAHSIVFNINVQNPAGSSPPDNQASQTKSKSQRLRNGTILGTVFTKDDSLAKLPLGGLVTKLIGSNVEFPDLSLNRRTTRIKTAIAMYVPEDITFSGDQKYETPSLLSTIGAGGLAAIATLTQARTGAISASTYGGPAALAGHFAGTNRLAGVAGVDAVGLTNLVEAKLGYAINPQIEVLFSQTMLRKFKFTFHFAPVNIAEADNVWNIIKTFRKHSAPGITGKGTQIAGAFFIPPSEFDISFLRHDAQLGFVENDNLPQISTCVLESVSQNYTPENFFATFTDGMPVHIVMTLNFMEVDIITSDRIENGF